MAEGSPRSTNSDAAGVEISAPDALRSRETYLYSLFEFSPFTTVVVDAEGRVVDFNAAKKSSGDRLPRKGDVMYRDYASGHSRDMHRELMAVIESGEAKSFPEMKYHAKVLAITIAPFPEGAIIVSQDVTESKRAEREMLALIEQLHRALQEIEKLRELLPICASCKRIRDDGGYWSGIEEYFGKRSKVNFSHTLCPECAQRLYPEVYEGHPERQGDGAGG